MQLGLQGVQSRPTSHQGNPRSCTQGRPVHISPGPGSLDLSAFFLILRHFDRVGFRTSGGHDEEFVADHGRSDRGSCNRFLISKCNLHELHVDNLEGDLTKEPGTAATGCETCEIVGGCSQKGREVNSKIILQNWKRVNDENEIPQGAARRSVCHQLHS